MRPRTWMTIPLALLAAQLLSGCGGPVQRRPVRIESNEPTTVGSVFPSGLAWMSGAKDDRRAGLLLRDGDLVLAGGGDAVVFAGASILPYAEGDGPRLDLAWGGWHVRLAGRIVTLNLSGRDWMLYSAWNDSARRWLTTATERELAGLRLLEVHDVDDSLSAATLAALRRLSTVNRHLGLVFDTEAGLAQVLPLFEPRALWLTDDVTDLHGVAANLGRVETLIMTDPDSASLDLLRSLPHLRQLFTARRERGPRPDGFAGLRALLLGVDKGHADPAALGSLPVGLEELSLPGVDSLDLSQLPELPKLRTLVLTGSELAGGCSSLDRFKRLRWLGLPKNTTPAELDTILQRHAGLTTLEIDRVDSLKDLTPLRAARGLQALIVSTQRIEHLDVVRELKSLRFVGIHVDTTETSRQQLAAIRAALPDALVVPITHLCLGSGWILLLLPASAACWLLGTRSRRRKRALLDG